MNGDTRERNRKFAKCEDFIDAMEIIYAILMMWGFAKIAFALKVDFCV